jgi:hypothetical protein
MGLLSVASPVFVKTATLNRLYSFRANSFQKQKLPVTDTAGRLIMRANLRAYLTALHTAQIYFSNFSCWNVKNRNYYSTSHNSRAKDVLARDIMRRKTLIT